MSAAYKPLSEEMRIKKMPGTFASNLETSRGWGVKKSNRTGYNHRVQLINAKNDEG